MERAKPSDTTRYSRQEKHKHTEVVARTISRLDYLDKNTEDTRLKRIDVKEVQLTMFRSIIRRSIKPSACSTTTYLAVRVGSVFFSTFGWFGRSAADVVS